jgi:hypothetical protein
MLSLKVGGNILIVGSSRLISCAAGHMCTIQGPFNQLAGTKLGLIALSLLQRPC